MKDHSPHLLEKKLSDYADLPAPDKALLLETVLPKTLKKGDLLLREGQVCRHIYFVEKGYLRTYAVKNGKEINLHFGLENTFVTELSSLRAETPSEYAIRTEEASLVWAFDKQSLLQLYEQSAEIARLGRALLEGLLADQEAHAHMFKLQTPAERYHCLREREPLLLQKVSLSQLASYLGISRETLSRIRKY